MKKFNKNLAVLVFALSFVLSGVPSFVALAAGPAAVNLGTAGSFTILSKTGISTTGSTSVVGDIGVSPISASAITGFALTLPAASPFSTSALVTGKVYASDYPAPTPSTMTAAVSDMQTAYTDAMGRAANVTELGAGNIGGLTIAPGVYKWGTGVTIPTDVTLSGSANDFWIFQIAQNLDISSATKVILSGGAQPQNIFWAVAGQTTLGTTSVFNGNILDQTAIVLKTGAKLNGKALAQTAVTLDSNAVTSSTSSSVAPVTLAPAPTTTPNPTPTTGGSSSPTNTPTLVPGNMYANTVNISGCNNGTTGFSIVTGQSCSSNTAAVATPAPIVISGCNGTIGFSTVNGQSCASNTGSVIATPTATTTYDFGSVTLKNGSKGNAVMELQRFLNDKLYRNLTVDGTMGSKTVAGVIKWQKDNGLVADGLVGAKTKAMMNGQVPQLNLLK